jgi:hypothetical protein
MSQATFARIYSETTNHIDRHMSRVREGRDVDAACFFARWLFWSGIPTLLKENAFMPDVPSLFKCDGAHLSWKLNELIEACNEYYVTNKPAGLHSTDLDSIREKLDKLTSNQELIAGGVAKLLSQSAVVSTSGAVAATPALPPAPGGGWGGRSPSLSKCHNSTNEKEVNRIKGLVIPENDETVENGKGSYPP